jgi:hypothetical protein
MAQLGIHYGVIHPRIDQQIRQQGFQIKSLLIVERHEKFREAINLLRLSQILTEAEADKAFKRLQKKVADNVVVTEDGN